MDYPGKGEVFTEMYFNKFGVKIWGKSAFFTVNLLVGKGRRWSNKDQQICVY